MSSWLNFVAIAAPRNGTTSHTVDPSSATGVVAGTPFTPTAGSRLVVVVEGAVTSTTPSGWTLPSGASAINQTGLYVFHRSAAGGDTFTTTHNGSNYAVVFAFFEFPSGTTFVSSVAATAQNATAANPNLTGLTGTNTVIGVAAWVDNAAAGTMSGTWSSPNTEILDTNTDDGATDGYWLGVAYQDSYVSSSFQPTPTITTGGSSTNSERLTFAVNPPAGGPAARTAADTLGTTDAAATGALTLARTASDTLGTTDSAARAALLRARTASDALGTSDSASRSSLTRARTAADTLGTTDAATRSPLTRARTATDSLGTTDSTSRSALSRSRTASDTLGTADTTARSALSRARTAGDTLGTTDTATRTIPGTTTVLSFDFDNTHYAKFAWNSVDFTGPFSVCFITQHQDPFPGGDKWIASVWDYDAGAYFWEFEQSGGDDMEFNSSVSMGMDGGTSGAFESTTGQPFIPFGKTGEIWFTWNGIPDFTGDYAGDWHWRNLTDDPTTWHHARGFGIYAHTLLNLVANGALFVGGNPEIPDSSAPFKGGIGFVGGWNADLYDNGSGYLGTDPMHSSTAELQAVDPSAMRWGADLTSDNPADILDLAGMGVTCAEITATLGTSIPEWTFNGATGGPVARTANDTLGTTDTATRGALSRSRTASDALGTTDAAVRTLTRGRTASDTLGTTDSAARSALTRARTVSDTLGTADSASRSALVRSRTATDALNTTDTTSRGALSRSRTAADSLSTTDAASRSALLRARTAGDALGTTDVAAGSLISGSGRAANDTLGTSDAATRSALLRSRTAADTLGTTDGTVRAVIRYKAASDTLGTSDSATSYLTRQVRVAFDVLNSTDAASRAPLLRLRTASDSLNTADAATASTEIVSRAVTYVIETGGARGPRVGHVTSPNVGRARTTPDIGTARLKGVTV